jgi:hypothetical protein
MNRTLRLTATVAAATVSFATLAASAVAAGPLAKPTPTPSQTPTQTPSTTPPAPSPSRFAFPSPPAGGYIERLTGQSVPPCPGTLVWNPDTNACTFVVIP